MMFFRKRLLFLNLIVLCLSLLIPPNQTTAASPHTPTDTYPYGDPIHPPVYDSNWVAVGTHDTNPVDIEIAHSLGGDRDAYLLELQCYDDGGLGVYDCVDSGFHLNAYWYDLTTSSVWVKVIAGVRPDYVRLLIYQETPDYDSGWDAIPVRPDPLSEVYTHNLQSGNYIPNLTCYSPTHHYYDCNALSNGSFDKAAFWHHFGPEYISVRVRGGSEPSQVRMRIYRRMYSIWEAPTYFTEGTDPITKLLNFDILNLPEENIPQIWCYDDSGNGGINQCTDQGFGITAYWFDLTPTSVQVRGMPADSRMISFFLWTSFQRFLPIANK
jgi:hypothetical protein